MRTNAWSILILAAVFAGVSSSPVAADVSSDRAAAILIFPRAVAARFVETFDDPSESDRDITVDTVFQISNVSDQTVEMQCFYVNANGHCSVSGLACGALGSESGIGALSEDQENCPIPGEFCIPGWVETDFRVYLTPRQPIAWRLSEGLAREQFPLDGTAFVGPRGESNAGSAVPPATLEPGFPGDPGPDNRREVSFFAGELKCVVVDAEGRGIARNVLKGEANVVTLMRIVDEVEGEDLSEPLVQRYNAIGIQAIEGDVNGDGVLELGGEAGEYNGCPNVLIADHFFTESEGDLAALTLVPCAENLRAQIPGSTTAQFLVFNEFEQRFSTSRPVDCYFNRFLPFIDTLQAERSIWSANVSGTIAGQTRIRGVSGGLLGVLTERPVFLFGAADSSNNLHFAGERLAPDLIVLP